MRKHISLFSFLIVFVAGIVHAQQVTKTFVNTPSSNEIQWMIASLSMSNNGSCDHLHLLVTVNTNWVSQNNAYIDATFGNRGGFSYQYTLRGAQVPTTSRLVAYQNASGGIDIYIDFPPSGYTTASYTILENEQETIYDPNNLVNVASNPAGTKVFDSSSSAYPPATYIDTSNNFSFAGNVKLRGSGSSLTFADGTYRARLGRVPCAAATMPNRWT